MARTYFTLATREDDGRWYPQFGDYDRGVVADEVTSYRGQGTKAKDIKIIASGARQADITAAIAKLNRDVNPPGYRSTYTADGKRVFIPIT